MTFRVDFKEKFGEFKEHLDPNSNRRILFSSKFGTGKSTFLNEYFEKFYDEYITIKLYPVNYSVASNEDVFELIKYDILAELINSYADDLAMQEEDFSLLLLGQSYIQNELKLFPLIKPFVKALIPKGKEILELGEAIKKTYKDFQDYSEKVKQGEKKLVDDYFQWHAKHVGNIYEKDAITILIGDLIKRVRTANSNKPAVLIIDDLDRLDPEHVFRLFNIFSAHYDVVDESNKFGFDKIIFVSDYKNLKQLFKNKYGMYVDFNGYMDKFYSSKVFEFDYHTYLNRQIYDLLAKKIREHHINGDVVQRNAIVKDTNEFSQFIAIIQYFVEHKLLTLRGLNQFNEFTFPSKTIRIHGRSDNANNYPFLTIIHLLNQFFSLEVIMESFEKIEQETIPNTVDILTENLGTFAYQLMESSLSFIVSPHVSYNLERDVSLVKINVGNEDFEVEAHPQWQGPPRFTLKIDRDYKINFFSFYKKALSNCIKTHLVGK